MNKVSIDEDNKLLCEFMGGKEVDWFNERIIIMPYSDHLTIHNYILYAKSYILDMEVKYHSSWDWLMDVINELKNKDVNYTITQTKSVFVEFNEVVKIVKWYNQNKQQ